MGMAQAMSDALTHCQPLPQSFYCCICRYCTGLTRGGLQSFRCLRCSRKTPVDSCEIAHK
jgi:hypothetical protein